MALRNIPHWCFISFKMFSIICLLLWKKKCMLSFLCNASHQIYHNVQMKCIWPFLKQNLNMFLLGVCIKCKSSSIHCFIYSINIYLVHACVRSVALGTQDNILAFTELKCAWNYQRPSSVFSKTFEYICPILHLNGKIHWEFFLNFIISISGGKCQKQDMYLMKEEMSIKAIHW